MKIKLCGLRRERDIEYANETCPDYAGFVFAQSRRQVRVPEAKRLIGALRRNIKAAGVFVNEDLRQLLETVFETGLDVVQLHGDEDNAYLQKLKELLPNIEIWRGVRVKSYEDIISANDCPADKLLLDAFSPQAYGGAGIKADWGLIEQARDNLTKPFFLAGGLNAGNILEAAGRTQPYGIDISGGIETNGYKDIQKIRELFNLIGRSNHE